MKLTLHSCVNFFVTLGNLKALYYMDVLWAHRATFSVCTARQRRVTYGSVISAARAPVFHNR